MNLIENIYSGVGRRKTSVCKTIIKRGSGKVMINKVLFDTSNINNNFINQINFILKLNNIENLYDIYISINGGGINSQFDAIKLSLAKAISNIDYNYKNILKENMLLKNDSRIKERKKYGLKKARKAPQFTKR
jgi:small subunit ribosomal protein S9